MQTTFKLLFSCLLCLTLPLLIGCGGSASHPSALVGIWVEENGNGAIELLRDGSGITDGIYAITWKADSRRLYITTAYQQTMVSNYSVSQTTLITRGDGEVVTFRKATAQDLYLLHLRTAHSTAARLSMAVELFMMDIGRPPTNEEGLVALIDMPPGLEGRWNGPYINERTSRIDPWGNDFLYASPGVNSVSRRYEIWSLGPNGVRGTAEEIIGHWMPAVNFR